MTHPYSEELLFFSYSRLFPRCPCSPVHPINLLQLRLQLGLPLRQAFSPPSLTIDASRALPRKLRGFLHRRADILDGGVTCRFAIDIIQQGKLEGWTLGYLTRIAFRNQSWGITSRGSDFM